MRKRSIGLKDDHMLDVVIGKRCTGPTLAAAVRAVTTGGHGA